MDGNEKPRRTGGGRRELERRLAEYEEGPASTPTWSEVRDRLRERSAIKARGTGGGAQRAGPPGTQGVPAHDDRQGTMKEPSRRGPAGRGPSDRRPSRPRDDAEEPRRFAPPGAGADQLLQLADELEDQARSLMQQARRLQHLAKGLERAEGDRPERPRSRPGGFERGGPRREGPRRERSGEDRDAGPPRRPRADARPRSEDGEARPRRRPDGEGSPPRKRPAGAPKWAPKGKKRKP